MHKKLAITQLNTLIYKLALDATENSFKPILQVPDTHIKGVVCVFHGLGGNPETYTDFITYLKTHNFLACSFALPAHNNSNGLEFNLTQEKIDQFNAVLDNSLSQIKLPLYFIGVSFGSSFAKHFADKYERPFINIAPFIEPKKWDGYFILKTLSFLNIIPQFPLGNMLSTLFPRFPVGASETKKKGLGLLWGSSIFCAYRFTQFTHNSPLRASPMLLMLSCNDTVVCNEAAIYRYQKTAYDIKKYNGSHNLLNPLENKKEMNDVIKSDIINFLTNQKTVTKKVPEFNFYLTLFRVLSQLSKSFFR